MREKMVLLILLSVLVNACAPLRVKQPMAQFLSPRTDNFQFFGGAELIEQRLVPSDTGAASVASNLKVVMPYFGAYQENMYVFVSPWDSGAGVGVGLKTSLLPKNYSERFLLMLHGDLFAGGSQKNSRWEDPGMILGSANAGLSAGWKLRENILVYIGAAAQASSLSTKYLQKTVCASGSCLAEELISDSSSFASNSYGAGLDFGLSLNQPVTLSAKVSDTAWWDSRTTNGRDLLYQVLLSTGI